MTAEIPWDPAMPTVGNGPGPPSLPLPAEGVGEHLVCDIHGAHPCDDEDFLQHAVIRAINEGGAELLHLVVHRFAPVGLSAVAVIAESHVAVHTWPEHEFMTVDVFTCGTRVKPEVILQCLIDAFGGAAHVRRLTRGVTIG